MEVGRAIGACLPPLKVTVDALERDETWSAIWRRGCVRGLLGKTIMNGVTAPQKSQWSPVLLDEAEEDPVTLED